MMHMGFVAVIRHDLRLLQAQLHEMLCMRNSRRTLLRPMHCTATNRTRTNSTCCAQRLLCASFSGVLTIPCK